MKVVDRGRPGGDEVPAVELQDCGVEARELLLHRILVAGRPKHPIVLLQLVADRLQMREQRGVEAVIGEKPGIECVEICAVGRLEDEVHVRPAALGREPILDLRIVRLGLQERVGALRHAHARKRRLRLFDQRTVERNLPRLPVVHFEHGDEMLAQQRPPLRVRRAWERALLPIPREPVEDQIVVDLAAPCPRASDRP